ncbi:MAG: alanine racemase, alanine racemase [Candidatus Peregrinibacteria bacterium GW2011_GWC2_39_14]|nr:MAG: Alanine racemase [Candidatus Peregrinibacteria bacterium GW2011_GWA2_38_36]KKR06719.1 MAG: alanine racemase, alanine racemase [Candidatus Peregrinibacteria bacterium GW2011_GWC2_39_14]
MIKSKGQNPKTEPISRVEISKKALEHNIAAFKSLIGKNVTLCFCVKANAYGHGLAQVGKIISEYKDGGSSIWLGVNAAFEAETLRNAGIKNPIYILGYVPLDQIEAAVKMDVRFVVYNKETVDAAAKAAKKFGKKARLHLKIETGNNRQGVMPEDAVKFAKYIIANKNLELEGISTHFANIEDTTEHEFASFQLENFKKTIAKIEAIGIKIKYKHCANTAATILFPKTHMTMVRVGIGLYGMWPSKETYVSALQKGRGKIKLEPILTWKTKIAQIKIIPEGSYIGYGCTYKTTAKTKIAIIPVGYYDGYDRRLSNNSYVLIHGKRAPICGRVCMNIIMVDVTDIRDVKLEDEVVLLGTQKGSAKGHAETISAEQMAGWFNTINYEVVARINERIPRKGI